MLSVYEYKEADEFLKFIWTEKKRKNPSFTIRAWSLQMGLKHHNPLHEMLLGKRNVPKSYLPKLIQSLNLDPQEGLYLELMVDLARAKNPEEKTMYLERMKAISPRKAVKFTELESFRMLQDPIHFFIAELALQKDFSAEPSWIQERLRMKATLSQIKEAIERLITLDILREDAEGRLHRLDNFIQSKSDISDRALKDYHLNLMELAKEAITDQDLQEREFQGMALNLDTSKLPEAKKAIREFIANFTTVFDKPKAPNEEVYQLNLQFFGITKRITK